MTPDFTLPSICPVCLRAAPVEVTFDSAYGAPKQRVLCTCRDMPAPTADPIGFGVIDPNNEWEDVA